MGHPDKGCIVAEGVKEGLINLAMAEADLITPNLVELRELSGLLSKILHKHKMRSERSSPKDRKSSRQTP